MAAEPVHPYVSRGGVKLRHALDEFGVDVAGLVCADLGCSTGGFTDCLLQAGARHVYAVDTGYGVLAWKLRQDPRVTVIERANALHTRPRERVDLVTIDLGWTKQEKAIPAALRWLRPTDAADARLPAIITLIKPHYETPATMAKGRARKGVLDDAEAEAVTRRVLAELPAVGVTVVASMRSPIPGGKGGNIEHLAMLRPAPTQAGTPLPSR